jgi:hypothetical protein
VRDFCPGKIDGKRIPKVRLLAKPGSMTDLAAKIDKLERELSRARLSLLKMLIPEAVTRSRTGIAPEDLTYWKADRHARRVPNFVIEKTGLRTKKEIVAKYGKGAEFNRDAPAS